jgi:hypothetical protein
MSLFSSEHSRAIQCKLRIPFYFLSDLRTDHTCSLASFRFVTNGTYTDHHSLFPRSLAQILKHSNTRELHLKFTLGRWDSSRWGAQIWDGKTAGGTGVELWAWVEAEDDASADARWTTLNNALSGLFCASLNFIDNPHHPSGDVVFAFRAAQDP